MQNNRYSFLGECSDVQNYHELILECAWKLNDWQAMKETHLKISNDTANLKLLFAYTAFHDGKNQVIFLEFSSKSLLQNEMDMLLNGATSLAIRQYQVLPEIPSNAHAVLFQFFQQLMEFKESTQVHKWLK